jgi:SAM-dependent methyltransferase
VRTIPITECPVCEHAGARAFTLGEARLRECERCGTVHAAEYADPAEVFTDGYLQGDSRFGIDLSHPRFQAYLQDVQEQRFAFLDPVVGERPRVLDVGCGTGEFLLAAQRRGWEGRGVDPVEASARIARERGVDVVAATLEESGLPERSFDLVCAFHVLEHMPAAPPFLRTLARWARPGGHVVVESPNWGSVLRRRRGERWIHLRPLEHLVHFTPRTLERAMRAAGLEPVRTATTSYLSRLHTLDDATASLARPGWARRLAPVCPTREMLGTPVKVPSRPVWALLDATAAAYDRRRAGAALHCVARVP